MDPVQKWTFIEMKDMKRRDFVWGPQKTKSNRDQPVSSTHMAKFEFGNLADSGRLLLPLASI